MSTSTDPGARAGDPTPEEFERRLALEGCVNFRDLGGYATADGKRTRWRTVFRADGLNRLTPEDLDLLRGLRLTTVIDLRTRDEAEQRGVFPVDEVPVRYHGLPLTDVLPTPEQLPDWKEASYVSSRYFEMVANGGPVLTRALRALAEDEALPAVMHCSAGKDRTGVLSAVLLAFLRVPDETIVADYALSGAAMERLFERLKAEYPDSVEAVSRFAPAVLHVAPETMDGFLTQVRDTYGSYEGLAAELEVTDEVEALRGSLLEPA